MDKLSGGKDWRLVVKFPLVTKRSSWFDDVECFGKLEDDSRTSVSGERKSVEKVE